MVCSSVGKHDEALRHHQLAYEFLAKGRDVLLKCRELGRVGQCRLTLGDLDGALECMKDKLQLASTLQDGENEESQAYVDLAAAYRAMGRCYFSLYFHSYCYASFSHCFVMLY